VVTEDMVRAVFNLGCQIIKDPLFGTPLCVPYGATRPIESTGADHAHRP
jgi:iron complex transport system ATP-binding protein